MEEDVYLIDGSAYIYRAYHGIKPLSNSKGLQTHAIFGFINILRRLMREREPRYVAVAFDTRGEVFRHRMYPDYKANRPPMPDDLAQQIPYIREFIAASNVLTLEDPDLEADDLIASAARHLSRLGHRVIIVSGDKDLLQLVDESITMWDPMKDNTMDPAAVEAKYKVPPERLLDLFALIGDSSDNVPGVPGIGPKTAEKLINQHHSLEGVYDGLSAMKPSKMKENLITNRDAAYLSKELIRLKEDVAVPGELAMYAPGKPDEARLAAMYTELEFTSFLKDIDTSEPISTRGFRLVVTREELQRLAGRLAAANCIVFDTETTSVDARTARLVGVSLCVDLDEAWYVPVGHRTSDGHLAAGQLPESEVKETLAPLLVCPTRWKVAHNLKYDYTVLNRQWGISLGGQLIDTMVAAHLLEIAGRSLKLDDLCLDLGLRLTPFKEVVKGDKRDDSFAYVELEAACNYSCEDVYGALRVWEEFEPQLAAKGLDTLFYDLEMPLIPILAAMEIRGICVDTSVLSQLSGEFSDKLDEIEKRIYQLAGREFNINSPRQLGQILFDELGLPYGRKTKTGYSTDVKVLEKLAARFTSCRRSSWNTAHLPSCRVPTSTNWRR